MQLQLNTLHIYADHFLLCHYHFTDLMILTQGVWFGDGEGDEEDVRVWVGEAPQAVVGLLARRVPQVELDLKYLDIAISE